MKQKDLEKELSEETIMEYEDLKEKKEVKYPYYSGYC